jgi:hypothetical protein
VTSPFDWRDGSATRGSRAASEAMRLAIVAIGSRGDVQRYVAPHGRAATLGRRLTLEDRAGTAVAAFERQMARWCLQPPSNRDQQETPCSPASSSLV